MPSSYPFHAMDIKGTIDQAIAFGPLEPPPPPPARWGVLYKSRWTNLAIAVFPSRAEATAFAHRWRVAHIFRVRQGG